MGDRAGAFVSQNDGGGFDDDDDDEERPSLKVREYDSNDDGVGKLGPTEVTIPAPRRAPGEDATFVFGPRRGSDEDVDGASGRRAPLPGDDFRRLDDARGRGEGDRTSAAEMREVLLAQQAALAARLAALEVGAARPLALRSGTTAGGWAPTLRTRASRGAGTSTASGAQKARARGRCSPRSPRTQAGGRTRPARGTATVGAWAASAACSGSCRTPCARPAAPEAEATEQPPAGDGSLVLPTPAPEAAGQLPAIDEAAAADELEGTTPTL